VSNDQSPTRKITPYKAGKRVSTVRKLNVDFAGTALEEALMLQIQAQISSPESDNQLPSSKSDTVSVESSGEQENILITSNFISSTKEDMKDDQENDQVDLQADLSVKSKIDHVKKDSENTGKHTDNLVIAQLINNSADKQLSRSNLVDKQPSFLSTKLVNTQNKNIVSEKQENKDSRLSTKSVNNQLPGYRTPNILDDEIMPNLIPSEQVILRRLFRLSYGFNRTITDPVSYSKLAEKCHLGLSAVKDALKSLQMKNLIKIVGDNRHNPGGGNCYLITLPLFESVSEITNKSEDGYLSTRSLNNSVATKLSRYTTKPLNDYIKDDDDHDDLKRQDHHQAGNVQLTNLSEHQQQVMMMYEKTTENVWTKADSDAYMKIKNIPLEKIEIALRLASDRAKNRPNSFAFFIKEILSVSSPKKQSRSQQKKAMEAIMNNIRNSKVGSSNYTISDFAFDVKEACIREDIVFDNNIFDELIEKKKG